MRVILQNPRGGGIANGNTNKQSFLDGRCGFWADVIAVNSRNNSVDVIADIGVTYRNIPVMSREWVNADKNKDYVTAERYLPPKGARVFILTPTHTISGAFVLCSGYVRGETETHTLYAQNDSEQSDKNTELARVTQGGWTVTEDYNNGNKNFVSQDENIKIAVNTTKNAQKSQEKEVAITAWDTEIHITESGIEISTKDDYAVTIKGKATIKVDGDCSVEGKQNVTVKATQACNVEGASVKVKGTNVEITGGNCKIGGTVTPTGSGAFCGIPACLFTGAPHVGSLASGT